MELQNPLPGRAAGYRFGIFEVDPETPELRKDGRLIGLRPQALQILVTLLNRPGEVVSREELKKTLWDDHTFVDFDQGLNHAIRELRAAIGDVADSPRFIQTLQKRGYRFIAPVEIIAQGPNAPMNVPAADRAGGPDVAIPTVATRPGSKRGQLILGAITAMAATLVAIAYLGFRSNDPWAGAPPGAIVVQPFVSPDDPQLGAGIAEAIKSRLGGQRSVSILSGASPEAFALGGELSIRGSEVSAVIRLQNAAGATVWSEPIKVHRDELFSVEAVLAERVVGALRLRLAAEEQEHLRRQYTRNSEAYGDYLRGRAELVKYTPAGTLAAIAAFERALSRDPDYALARAGLAMASADMYLRFASSQEVERWGERADAEARTALESNPDLAEAHLARAAVARKRDFDWNATMSSSRRALTLNPNLEQARYFMAAAYYHNGFMEEARIEMERGRTLRGADQLEPLRIDALVAMFSGSFAAARGRLEEESRLTSQPIGDTYLALAYYYTGSAERAQSLLEALTDSRSASTATRATAAIAGVLAAQGKPDAARQHLDRVLLRGYRDHHVAYSIGAAYAQLGEDDKAAQWLRTAADTGFACLPFYERDPLLEGLRRQEQFSELRDYVRSRRDVALAGASH